MNALSNHSNAKPLSALWVMLNGVLLALGSYFSSMNYCALYGLQVTPEDHGVLGLYAAALAASVCFVATGCSWGLRHRWGAGGRQWLASVVFSLALGLLAINQVVLNLLGVTLDDPFTLAGLFSGVDFLAKWSSAIALPNYIYGTAILAALVLAEKFLGGVLHREALKRKSKNSFVVALLGWGLLASGIFWVPGRVATELIFRALPFAQFLEEVGETKVSRYLKKVTPKTQPQVGPLQQKPHVFFVLLESWRFDSLSPERMPQLAQMLADGTCVSSKLHVSGSHVTNLGAFTLLYGMEPLYYHTPTKDRPAWAIEALRANGYKTVGAINSVINTSFRKNFDRFVDHTKHQPFWEGDDKVLQALRDGLKNTAQDQSFFGFGFLFSSHHNYYYPERFEKNRPVSAEDYDHFAGDDKLEVHKTKIVNRYKNSLLYLDDLIARHVREVQKLVKERGQSAVFVITGDHGEEFWDTGPFLGHGADTMVDHRVRVPLMMCGLPLPNPNLSHTSHAMIWPTIFDGTNPGSFDAGLYPEVPPSFLRQSGDRVSSYSIRYPRNASMFAVYRGDKKYTGKLLLRQKRAPLLKINDQDVAGVVPEEQLFWNKHTHLKIQELLQLERDALGE